MPDAIMTSALLVTTFLTYQCTMNMSISTTLPSLSSNISLTVKKVNSRSSHTVGKVKAIRMDLNPNKISTRFRK